MLTAVIVSLLSGITIVVARTCNAGLALQTSVLRSTLYNYVVGLACAVAVLLAVGGHIGLSPQLELPKVWIYLGGIVGVVVILISNDTVSKISSFSMTLLLFIGQVFTGILLDILLTRTFSWGNLVGGTCVAIGLTLNLRIGRRAERN